MTVLMTAVANWFRRRLGIASGIVVSGFGLGGLLILVIVQLIEMYEWRMTMTILALGTLITVLPLSLLFRHKPEQYGYLPDGKLDGAVTFGDSSSLPQAVKVGVQVKQILKSSTFWHIALSFMFFTMIVGATITHIMPYLSSIGIARSMSSLVATALPLMSIGGRLSFGWLGDKTDKRLVATGAFSLMGFGVLGFGYTSSASAWPLVLFLILFGIGYGGGTAMRPSLTMEYFGRTNFGTIFGLLMGVNMLGAIAGPTLAGWVYDSWGSYQGIWLIFAGFMFIALVSVLTIAPANRTEQLIEK